MKRNIVICSDGTGNTFDRSVSNVTRLVRLLALEDREAQIVIYDQGIGTNAKRLDAVHRYQESIPDKGALRIVERPTEPWFCLAGWPARLLGLLAGYGLKANIRKMSDELRQLYRSGDDNVFLFGFSRGAFTVRALAGLIYRCGLPRRDVPDFERCFDEAWRLYQPHREDEESVRAFRHCDSEECGIHFMGLWDTVKSYGGLFPISLPHLRHNPIVRHVRHALALDERRTWFNATTWGQLDRDECGAGRRLKERDRSKYRAQSIEEAWFRGSHSDIGGGDCEEITARIALRWMLGEAAEAGIRLNEDGRSMLATDDPAQPPELHESLRGPWWLTEILPRLEIDNSGLYPEKHFTWRRLGHRTPGDFRRQRAVAIHTSVSDPHSIPPPVEIRPTRSIKT